MNYNKFIINGIKKMLPRGKSRMVSLSYAKYGIIFLFTLSMLLGTSCKKAYLDVVPDNVVTIADAFASKLEAQKYLFTCYSYLPNNADPSNNPGLMAGDELWGAYPALRFSTQIWSIARGEQNAGSPDANYMEGTNGGSANYKAIRDCNVFLENISDLSKVRDLDIDTRTRWIGEVQFLKAFYHFMLFRAYGPIPIIDKNLPISTPLDQMRVTRQPVDAVVNYIAALLDTAATRLPLTITNTGTELGRITKPIALSLKARLLATAASPLFNGNSDYGSFKGKDGVALFNPTYSVTKWQKAADACKAAIDLCSSAGIQLYTLPAGATPNKLSDTTITQLGIRNAVSEPWNSELIWGLTVNNGTYNIQANYAAGLYDITNDAGAIGYTVGPTLKMAKLFYTQNGVPTNEDKTDQAKKLGSSSDKKIYLSEKR
ncbi:MAG: RagB/SusD family nutrient uptake outer membrane protein [Sphingobacteriales bacterium]